MDLYNSGKVKVIITSAYKTQKTKIPFVARETFFYIGYKWYRVFIK